VPLAVAREYAEAPPSEAALVLERFALPERYLLCPQGYHPHKNQDLLLEALAEGAPEDLAVVFSGSRTEELEDRIPGAIGVGVVSEVELRGLYEACWGVVVPSLYEAGSFPVIEGMARRRPAAASRIPSIVEQVTRYGASVAWFDPSDTADMRAAVTALWRRENIDDALLDADRDRVLGRTWADVAAGYARVLRDVTAAGGPRGGP